MNITKVIEREESYTVVSDETTLSVPKDSGNRHYREVEEWITNGGVVEEYVEPVVVPSSVTMRQARLALLQAGLLLAVEDEINLLDEPYRTQAKIEWEYATHVERISSLVGLLTSKLSMSVDDIDQLFITASTL